MPCALVFALARLGRSMLARMAMIAITTSNSIKVNAAMAGWRDTGRKPRECEGAALMALNIASSFRTESSRVMRRGRLGSCQHRRMVKSCDESRVRRDGGLLIVERRAHPMNV